MDSGLNILLVYGGGNDLGRAYCLWLIAQELGWHTEAYANQPFWAPLAGSGFKVNPIEHLTGDRLDWSDVVIVYQPLPDTLGMVLPRAKDHGKRLIVDIDDPHWEARYGWDLRQKLRIVVGKAVRGESFFASYKSRWAASHLPIIVASPFVSDRWPGELVPHVRQAQAPTPMPEGEHLRVAFIGTPRRHKGLEMLRAAAAEIRGIQLVITAERPSDARPNEEWVGTTTLAQGRELLAGSHLAAVLQDDSPWTRRQSPVKVVDALMGGRVVLGSDLPPVRWAAGDTALLVPAGDRGSVLAALENARDNRDALTALGDAGRRRAESKFTPSVVANTLKRVAGALGESHA